MPIIEINMTFSNGKVVSTRYWKHMICLLLAFAALSGCGKPAKTPDSTVYDIPKMAYQSPEFIENYFGARPYTDFTGKLDPSRRMKRYLEYPTGEDLPGILVTFDHNQAVEITVFFPHQQTPQESAQRLDLNLSDFQFVSRTSWLLTLRGKSQGVLFTSVTFTNLTNQRPGSWNVIANFAERPIRKPLHQSGSNQNIKLVHREPHSQPPNNALHRTPPVPCPVRIRLAVPFRCRR